MITAKQIEKTYGKRIPRKFRVCLEKYIDIPDVQEMLRKALDYDLNNADLKWLWENGRHPDYKEPGKYPGLNYICLTFIHPITKWQALAEKVDRLAKSI